MLTTLEFADFLSAILNFEDVYANNLDGNQDKCLGIFDRNSGKAYTAIGGKQCTKTKACDLSVCVHWSEVASVCEQKANEILKILLDIKNYDFENFCIKYISCDLPFNLGKNERGISEYAINFKVYYERID